MISRNRLSFLPSWKPTDSIDQNLRKISRDDYLTIVSIFGSLCGLVHGFLTILSGMMLVDNAFLQEMYRHNDSKFSDRFIMLFFAGEILGSLMSFPFSDTFGRKTTLIYTSIFCIFAIIWNVLTTSGADFLTSRFFVGWAMGVLLSTSPVYTSEIAVTAYRGYTIGMLGLTTITGSLMAGFLFYLLKNYAIGWRVCLIVPIVVLIIKAAVLSLLPESPRWLLALRTPAECLDSMRQLRRTNDVSREFNDIYLALSSDARLGESWTDILSSKTIRYRLFVCCVMQLSQQMMGINIITTFGSDFLQLINVHSILLGLSLAYIAALLGTLLGLAHIDIWGRRFIFIFGCVSMACSWIGAATCVYVGECPLSSPLLSIDLLYFSDFYLIHSILV
jgi:MFS transporter, SP family, major inositol transporter